MDVNLDLVTRLETTSARASLDLVEAIALIDPATIAEGRAFHGGALVAMGPGRYVNRAIGVTTTDLSTGDVDELEQFFAERGLPSMIELSSWAPPPTIKEVAHRKYAPAWFRSVFACVPGDSVTTSSPDIRIVPVGDADAALWLDVFARGFEAEHGEMRIANDEIGAAGRIAPNAHTFLAYMGRDVVGCGSIQIIDGIAWLGGAATVPAYRRRGVQAALVSHRLRLAAVLGCDLAAVTALANGPSARNIIRLGFQHTHTQVVVERRSYS